MRPANPNVPGLTGRNFRVGSGITRGGWHRLENRHLWPIPYFMGGALRDKVCG